MQLPAFMTGAPGRNRTCGLQLRRLSLYPTELRARRPTCRGSFYACQEQGCWRPGQTHLISAFADLLFDGIIRQNQPFVCRLRHLALLAAHVLEYALLSMPVRLARLANGHGPLGRLPVGFRAKSAIFLAGTQKSCFSRCDEGALAVGELVSRTEKDSNASYG